MHIAFELYLEYAMDRQYMRTHYAVLIPTINHWNVKLSIAKIVTIEFIQKACVSLLLPLSEIWTELIGQIFSHAFKMKCIGG